MKLPLRLVASILLTSVRASSDWPYHEIVGAVRSARPVYGVAPATLGLLPREPINEARKIVEGVAAGTLVEGSSSGPVTVVSPGTAPNVIQTATIPKSPDVSPDTVLVKGPSAGPVTLIAPVDNRHIVAKASSEAGTGIDGASARADVAIGNAKESTDTTNGDKPGTVSANAVIGPTTRPIVIAGPTAPPIPPALIVPSEPVADPDASAAASKASAITNATDSRIESSASSSASVTSGTASATAMARVNSITPAAAAIASTEAASLSNLVVSAPSAIVSVPAGTVTSEALSSLLNSLSHLQRLTHESRLQGRSL